MNARLVGPLAASLTLAFALSACGGTPGTQSAAQTGSNRPADASTSNPNETTAAEPTTPSNDTITFGETRTYTDGLSITVSKPVTFKPSEYAAKEPAKAYVKFTVTIVNGTGTMFDPSMASATVQSANTEASTVYDSEAKLEGSPSTKLLKGREVKFQLGFGVDDPKDIVMEMNPSFEHDSAIFTN